MQDCGKKDLHVGHRERLRKEFLENGITSATPPHKILEFILFYSIPRRDTNELAHILLNKFGSFSSVLDAPVSELKKINGINDVSISLIKSLIPISRIYLSDKAENGMCLKTRSDIGTYILGQYAGYTSEVASVLCTNNLGKIISFDTIGDGDTSMVNASPRKILEIALRTHATAMILAHNHPGGIAIPSKSDISATAEIATLLSSIGVRLIDHIIVADGDYISMSQSQQYKSIFNPGAK